MGCGDSKVKPTEPTLRQEQPQAQRQESSAQVADRSKEQGKTAEATSASQSMSTQHQQQQLPSPLQPQQQSQHGDASRNKEAGEQPPSPTNDASASADSENQQASLSRPRQQQNQKQSPRSPTRQEQQENLPTKQQQQLPEPQQQPQHEQPPPQQQTQQQQPQSPPCQDERTQQQPQKTGLPRKASLPQQAHQRQKTSQPQTQQQNPTRKQTQERQTTRQKMQPLEQRSIEQQQQQQAEQHVDGPQQHAEEVEEGVAAPEDNHVVLCPLTVDEMEAELRSATSTVPLGIFPATSGCGVMPLPHASSPSSSASLLQDIAELRGCDFAAANDARCESIARRVEEIKQQRLGHAATAGAVELLDLSSCHGITEKGFKALLSECCETLRVLVLSPLPRGIVSLRSVLQDVSLPNIDVIVAVAEVPDMQDELAAFLVTSGLFNKKQQHAENWVSLAACLSAAANSAAAAAADLAASAVGGSNVAPLVCKTVSVKKLGIVNEREALLRALSLLRAKGDTSSPATARAWYCLGVSLTPGELVQVTTTVARPSSTAAARTSIREQRRLLSRRDCFIKSIAVENSNSYSWHGLGLDLAPGETVRVLSEEEEEEGADGEVLTKQQCIIRALRCCSTNAFAWNSLGNTFVVVPPSSGDEKQPAAAAAAVAAENGNSTLVEFDLENEEGTDMTHVSVTKQNCYARAVQLDPTQSRFWNNLATTMQHTDFVELTLPMGSSSSSSDNNQGTRRSFSKRNCYEEAVKLNPSSVALTNLAMCPPATPVPPTATAPVAATDSSNSETTETETATTAAAAAAPPPALVVVETEAQMLKRQHEEREAKKRLLIRALEQGGDPTYRPAWLNLGHLLKPGEQVCIFNLKLSKLDCFQRAQK